MLVLQQEIGYYCTPLHRGFSAAWSCSAALCSALGNISLLRLAATEMIRSTIAVFPSTERRHPVAIHSGRLNFSAAF
jgi:hypothetical protein